MKLKYSGPKLNLSEPSKKGENVNLKIQMANSKFDEAYQCTAQDVINFLKSPTVTFNDDLSVRDLNDKKHKEDIGKNCFKCSELTPDLTSCIEILKLEEEENAGNLINFNKGGFLKPEAEGQSKQELQSVDLLLLNVLEEDPTPSLEAVKTSPTAPENKTKMKESYIKL